MATKSKKTLSSKAASAKRKRLKKQGKSGIVIKPQNKGKFLAWCKAHGFKSVTAAAIAAGKRSKSASVRKMATFAANARKWKK